MNQPLYVRQYNTPDAIHIVLVLCPNFLRNLFVLQIDDQYGSPLDCMSPPQNEATHPRCCDEGCLDGPGRASNKEG
ncbi:MULTISPECIES: hypothetical protein, partial [unclassified Bradyrhizobium]|uniref:hypothetical protein n=1 Tax=unclassified Bradyrhizobium TaxID=2631580 RepID=UPI001FF89522